MARWVLLGSLPACQAMTASTANSGIVCSQARMASASPCDIRNCAASAAQAMTKEEKRMLGKVQRAERGEFAFGIIGARILMKTISSRQNALFKRVRDAVREHGDEIVIEGPKAVSDAVAAGWRALLLVIPSVSEGPGGLGGVQDDILRAARPPGSLAHARDDIVTFSDALLNDI